MRRQEREIKEFEELIAIMNRCDVCRLAICDEPVPYILPLNFGLEVQNGQAVLYFHGAKEGRKYELLAKNSRAAFEMDCGHQLLLLEESGNCTMEYESVIGSGAVEILPEEEKERGLDILMRQYRGEDFPYNKKAIPQTTVFKLTVEEMTGKRRGGKKQTQ